MPITNKKDLRERKNEKQKDWKPKIFLPNVRF